MAKHQVEIEIRWGDMDAYGHVNNTLFFRYLEIARFKYIETLALNKDGVMPTIVLAEMRCRFVNPLVYPATITVASRVTKLGSSSFELEANIHEGEKLCASSHAVLVWVNPQTHKPEKLPPDIRQTIAQYEGL